MRKKNHSASIFKKEFSRVQRKFSTGFRIGRDIVGIRYWQITLERDSSNRFELNPHCDIPKKNPYQLPELLHPGLLEFSWSSKEKKKRGILYQIWRLSLLLWLLTYRAMPYFQQLKNSTRCEKMGLASSSRSANLIIILTFQRILWLLLKINIHECVDNRIVDLQRIFHPHFITFNKRWRDRVVVKISRQQRWQTANAAAFLWFPW